MKRQKSLLLILLLMLGLSAAKGQHRTDSLQLMTLLDSAENLFRKRDLDKSLGLISQLLVQSKEKDIAYFDILGHTMRGRIHMANDEYDAARRDFRTSVEIAQRRNRYELLIKSVTSKALLHFNFSEFDSAELYYNMAAETAGKHVPKRYGLSLANVGFIHGVVNDRKRELEAFMKALDAVDSIPDSRNANGVRGMVYSSLGDYYAFIGEYEKARDFYERKLTLSREIKSKRIEYEARAGLGSIYRSKGYYDFEKSKESYEVVANETDELFGHYVGQARINLGRLHREEGLYEEALDYYNKAYDYYIRTNSSDQKASVQTEIGETYLGFNQLDEARKWLKLGLASAGEKQLISRERRALSILYKVDSLQGRYLDALKSFQRLTVINDTLSSERVRNRLQEIQVKYETEQTAKENLELKSNLELKEAEVNRQRIIQAFVVVVALAFVVLALLVYFNYQRKRKDHDTITLQSDELRKLSRFKDGLTSMVVHDMRNPLNAILGFSQGTPTDEKLRSINRSGNQVLNLVNNMLDIQRFEEAQMELNPEVIDARLMVTEAMNEVHLLAAGKSLKIINHMPIGLNLKADPILLNRIIANLLINSIKYSKSGGTIVIEAGGVDGVNQELIVRDEGHGIAEDQLPYIFNKFWHNDPERSGVMPSTGLGLSFCKLAVEAHNGRIRAESILHEGTSMIFSLPVEGEPVEQLNAHETTPAAKQEMSEEDVAIYTRFLPDFEQLEVHQVSAINKLVKALEQVVSDKIWGNQLRMAAYQGDQERYKELLTQLRKEALA